MNTAPETAHHIPWPELRRLMENADRPALGRLLDAARDALLAGRAVHLVQPSADPATAPLSLRVFSDAAALNRYRDDIERALRIARNHTVRHG